MQQRSLETRRILMEATLDAMCELGYHQSSTTEIIRRAGVSRGAMLHHYPTKVALLSATFEYLHDLISADVELLIEEAEKESLTWADLLDDIMARYFQGRLWDAFLELMVAARTDRELWQQLVPTVQKYYTQVDDLWHRHFTTNSVDSEVATLLNLSLCVIRGMALQMLLRDDPHYYEEIMRQWKAIIAPLVKSKQIVASDNDQKG